MEAVEAFGLLVEVDFFDLLLLGLLAAAIGLTTWDVALLCLLPARVGLEIVVLASCS